MQSIAIANPLIFNGKIDCTFLEDRPDAPSTSGTKSLCLRIEERSLDNSETEIRIELGNPDDLEFLYADGITRQKYKELSTKWNIESSFEDCFRMVLAPILRDTHQPVQYRCSLSKNGSSCLFEIVAKRDFILLKVPMELHRVSGDALIKHLVTSVRNYQKKTAKLSRSLEESSRSQDRLMEQLEQLKESNAALFSSQSEMKGKMESMDRKKMEAENDAELKEELAQELQEEKENLLDEIQRLNLEVDELNRFFVADDRELAKLKAENSALRQECSTLKIRVTAISGDLSKAKHLISKYYPVNGDNIVSMDERKLREMQEALEEKDAFIEQSQVALQAKTKELMEQKTEIDILEQNITSKNTKIQELEKTLTLYRSNNSPLLASRIQNAKLADPPRPILRPTTNIAPPTTNNLATNPVFSPKPSFRQSRVSTPTFDAMRKNPNVDK